MLLLRWLVAVAAVLVSVSTASPAFAHAALISSDPADGAELDTPPTRITLTFNQDIERQFATVTVSGPDGTPYADGAVRVDGPTVVVDVKPLGAAAAYAVAYRVISADGHPISGKYSFQLTRAAPTVTSSAAPTASAAPAAAAPAESDERGFPAWIAVAAAVVLAGLAVVMVRRRG
ncbi:copper resistance CopC family protein [Mycolicibacterium arenosum]|uniref:Copper resistance protein CopC n=1 Tax=Mycolicibacterium arenosum TaxID=2952157 RepID=A0ABT1LZ67_9MYCO|nr:copper resistance CopC family protein [Mycolicibacterium sp. CAU 1645]MCP9271822.1 copper resistance protein CopC [Mycolicibacterium sp. CAU 1645]